MYGRMEGTREFPETDPPPLPPSPPLKCKALWISLPCPMHRLVGLVVKAPASRAEDPGFDSHFRRGDFSGSSHSSDLKIGAPVANLPGIWQHRVSAGTGWPGVSILRLGEIKRLQLLSQSGNTYTCLSRSVPEIQCCWTFSNEQTTVPGCKSKQVPQGRGGWCVLVGLYVASCITTKQQAERILGADLRGHFKALPH